MHQKGFTLVELVIVFSIIALLSITGLASFSAFSQRQQLSNSVSDLRTIFNVARTRTLSQVNGTTGNFCTSSEQFGGYVVLVCCTAKGSQTNCPSIAACNGTDDYDMFETCYSGSSTAYKFIQGGKFSNSVAVDASTTARTFQFTPLTGAVSFGAGGPVSQGAVTLTLIGSTQTYTGTVTVTSIGAIQ
ncbi:MAG: prepilin-type N-terminal cleavage/methylation domain-containing protein [Patescibacteria group bacterium]|nr:prepilin-type N-terminal cleavage/methylation domain-containing protein [Patescibacteria group bacterium]MDE2590128.1 prepilin-type N-terminal cleavage/methylation domain-containing protein [Patescibacteria group bacterium]